MALTIISILLMLVSISYFVTYISKKKNNTQNSIGYKVVYATALILLCIPIVLHSIDK